VVLHRPVEPAGIIGNWLFALAEQLKIFSQRQIYGFVVFATVNPGRAASLMPFLELCISLFGRSEEQDHPTAMRPTLGDKRKQTVSKD
jgi:hypothetical protein